jgi:hypothetical protein
MKANRVFPQSLKAAAAAALLVGSIGAAHAGSQSFQVFANSNSTAFNSHDAAPLDTGLFFGAGDALHVTATGTWNGGGCGDVGPTGTGCFGNDPHTGINYFSLIGRVGNGSYFKVGNSFDGVAASSGDLFLAFLDVDSFNNSGFVTATVATTPAVPEPQTGALLLSGVGALVFLARRSRRPFGRRP